MVKTYIYKNCYFIFFLSSKDKFIAETLTKNNETFITTLIASNFPIFTSVLDLIIPYINVDL